MKFINAPWRWEFISKTKPEGCIFCQAQKSDDEQGLILFRGEKFFVILNKYPYTSGHLMIAPYAHLGSLDQMAADESVELWSLLTRSLAVLKKKLHPDGFNIGLNIGQAAGAGIRDHFHFHLVPRWQGDANFISIIGDARVLSYDVAATYRTIRDGFNCHE